jgi:hypothetical protein
LIWKRHIVYFRNLPFLMYFISACS